MGKIYVGVDWARQHHQVCVLDEDGSVVGERSFRHDGTGLAKLCEWLQKLAGDEIDRVSVAIEVPHGAVVETLLERRIAVYDVNPKQLDRFRDRFTMAGSKDDRLDARVLADALRTDVDRLRRIQLDEPEIIELRSKTRIRDELVSQRAAAATRFREELWRYFPQMSELTKDVTAEWFLELWERVPTPDKASRVRTQTVDRILRQHRIRRIDGEAILGKLRQPPLKLAPGTTEAAIGHIELLIEQIRLLNRQIKKAERRIEQVLDDLNGSEDEPGEWGDPSDVDLLRSLPGVGKVVLATLVAEAGVALRNRDYHALRARGAVAPVTRRSGKSTVVVMRRSCNPRLRNAMRHWADNAYRNDPASHTHYTRLRARGHSHERALRGVQDRMLAVACAMLRNRTMYDPSRRTAASAPSGAA